MATIVFAGSPVVAVPYLRALASIHNIALVLTREDALVGRKKELTATPVAVVAAELGLPLLKTNSFRDVDLPACDLGVVVAYGALVPDDVLHAPAHGWINLHYSLLPKLRGAAPVQRGLWNGDKATGISIFQLVSQLDAGPVFFQREIPFESDETASDSLRRLSETTVVDLTETIDGILGGRISAREQTGEATSAPKFSRDDARIDWHLPATVIANRVRALASEPGAYTELNKHRIGIGRVRVSHAESGLPGSITVLGTRVYAGTGDGTIEVLTVKPAGKGELTAIDWARGLRGVMVFT
jgi:methionyl-tRNA formyltransferase